jgi:hypothetical protein
LRELLLFPGAKSACFFRPISRPRRECRPCPSESRGLSSTGSPQFRPSTKRNPITENGEFLW